MVGDESTLKVHVHTDDPEAAMEIFHEAGEVTNLDVADMRKQIAKEQELGDWIARELEAEAKLAKEREAAAAKGYAPDCAISAGEVHFGAAATVHA